MEKNYLMISGEISLPLKSHKSKYPNLIYQNYQTLKIPDFPELKFPEISFPKPQPVSLPQPTPTPKPKPQPNSEWVERNSR
jgi:hypothetical protein